MSRANAAMSLPPGDRDDAPSFDLGEAIRDTPLLQDELPAAPALTDPTTISRLTRLGRHTTEGSKYVMEALRLLAEGHYGRRPRRHHARIQTPDRRRLALAAPGRSPHIESDHQGVTTMSLLQPAVSTSAFLKMGLLGFQGGGKTLTAGKVAIGLVKHLQKLGIDYANKPVAMFDTETGSDWLIPIFAQAHVNFIVAKKSSFADLLKVMDEAEKEASVLIIDSITHPWRELCQSYMRKKQRSYLQMDDWGYLKGEHGWKQFTDRYINGKLHVIMAGRAGYEYENYEEDGRKKMEKVGTKMKTEGETGFEPSLLVLMEQVEDMRSNKVVHRATVQKDRSTLLDGAQIDNPDFEDFLPHINCLALGGSHLGVTSGDSQHILHTEKRDWSPVQRKICLGEIQDLLVLHIPGQTAAEKQRKVALLKQHFQAGWVEIEEVMPLEDLRIGYDRLHRELEKDEPSRYAALIAAGNPAGQLNDNVRPANRRNDNVPLNDSLPDHSSKEGAAAQAAAQPEQQTLEQKLIGDLPDIKTVPGLLAWAIEVTNKHRAALGEDAFNRVNVAMMARQTEILKQESQDGGETPEPSKNDPKPTPDLGAVDPKTGAPAFLTREPKPDAKPKSRAKAGGDNTATVSPALQAADNVGGMYGLINA